MNLRDIPIIILSISLIIFIFSLNSQHVSFNSDNTFLENQFAGNYGNGHHGLDEIYSTMYAGILLFITSIISAKLLYERFGKSRFTWRPVIAGIFVSGLIGLGETLEHLFNTMGHEFFHYLHLLAGLLAMYFLYVGTQEYRMQFRQGGRPISPRSIIGMIIILPLLAMVIALNSEKAWDTRIELPFIYLSATPTLFLAGMTLLETYRQKEAYKILMGFLGILAATVTFLSLIILVGRLADIGNYAYLYVLTFSLQNIFLSATAMLILIFTFTMWAMCSK